MDGATYDRIVLTAIFIVELIDFLRREFKSRRAVKKAQRTRRFNRILKSVGL